MEEHIKIEDSNESSDEKQFEQVKQSAWKGLKLFFKELLDLREETDRETTIENVKTDISIKGHNAWILIFSIFVASIGLNVSSAAVVIGAMLISPLMGPIVGLGLSVAINDVETLKKSLINLGVMVALSVITAYLYFSISPLTKETPELLARTYPTILDVLIAIFGGLALIVAKTKKGTMASVIFGVAIATALMPPLCTVGYGLAIGNINYAGGAIYLFSINAVFIALTTFLIAKILRFPMVKYANSKRRKRIAQIATSISVIVIVPSVILFLNLLKVQVFENKAKEFITTSIKHKGAVILKSNQDYDLNTIEVYLIGRLVPESVIDIWREELRENSSLNNAKLEIFQAADQSGDMAQELSGKLKFDILDELYEKNEQLLKDKEAKIKFLENQLTSMKVKELKFDEISKEVKMNYSEIQSISYYNKVTTNFRTTDTVPVFSITWDSKYPKSSRQKDMETLNTWLKYKLKLDTLLIK
ncbi:MAG: DUF389 domain-containing protein [Flavobacteriaceae bacterium]|nr:DUF389 domain-containing protein [Flavobacteriaceae bacterium]MDG1790486.1 DUF389 domain-containing protein [Flavobacteriaceae bacterium]MDG2447674.1 DUF389 domain-containing protein [Flavobacteriaceae bacterium]